MQEYSLARIPRVDLKLELDDPPTHEEINKATMQLEVGKSPSTDGIPAEVISTGEKQYSISSRICSPTVGRKGLYRRTSGMRFMSLCTKKRQKIRQFKLLRHHSALHCRQNLGLCLAE